MAIMEFLEETFPKVKLLPEGPLNRAKVLPKVMMPIHFDMYSLHF